MKIIENILKPIVIAIIVYSCINTVFFIRYKDVFMTFANAANTEFGLNVTEFDMYNVWLWQTVKDPVDTVRSWKLLFKNWN